MQFKLPETSADVICKVEDPVAVAEPLQDLKKVIIDQTTVVAPDDTESPKTKPEPASVKDQGPVVVSEILEDIQQTVVEMPQAKTPEATTKSDKQRQRVDIVVKPTSSLSARKKNIKN